MYNSLLLILTSVTLSVLGQTILKCGVQRLGRIEFAGWGLFIPVLMKVITNPLIVLGLALYAISSIIWIVVISRVELSFAYPMLAMGYLLIVLVSIFVFRESVSVTRWAGISAIIFGVVLVTRS